MKRSISRGAVAAAIPLVIALAAAGASTPAHRRAVSRPVSDTARYTKADVLFMQGMIGHHAQALVMTDLVPARAKLPALRMLAERIEVSQRDEIKLMQRWLEDRGELAPKPGAKHEHHAAAGPPALMPGMLTADELAQLAAAKGTEFDRRFLELMIRHHEGAVTMVAQLFGIPGAGQEVETFRFASDVDADQRAEIRRMRAVLDALPNGPRS